MPLCSNLTREESKKLYAEVLAAEDTEGMRSLCKGDLFFLLLVAFRRKDVDRDWLYDRCREVEADPNGYLDLWSREHYKSTIITYALTIQDILKDPDITIGIFSHTRPIAKAFLDQIKREFEDNEFLKDLFPEILYKEPKREAPTWSLDGGIVVKRKSNPKEKTIEAWGLVDGQPISKHFKLLLYDDVVTLATVNTPDQIKQTIKAFGTSLNLGDTLNGVVRGIGTRYHFNDPYRDIMEKSTLKVRYHLGTDDGTATGEPFLWTREILAKKRQDMGPHVFACQILQNPKEDSVMGFDEEWLRFYDRRDEVSSWNYYILVDPAGDGKKKHSNDPDYSVILVMATGSDGNLYLVDGVRDRISLTQRTKILFRFHRAYRPLGVAYEKYGKDSDIEHIEDKMSDENYRFKITPVGGSTVKNDRIRKLVPDFEQSKIWLPRRLMFVDREGNAKDLVRIFIEDEYVPFPVPIHDDILDCMARIKSPDLKVQYPEEESYYGNIINMKPVMAKKEYQVLRRLTDVKTKKTQATATA